MHRDQPPGPLGAFETSAHESGEAMRNLVFPVLLIALSGCGNPLEFDPAKTVILKITGVEDEAEKERIKEKAEELVLEKSAWRKTSMSEHAETLMIKLSPVKDPQGFADRITFGKVTAVDGNTIHVQVGDDQEEGKHKNADDQADDRPHQGDNDLELGARD
jgi:predicted small lipoprotein YifL